MGKNGRALREAKANNVTYTFTSKQLQEHDEHVLRSYRERVAKEASAKIEEQLAEQEKEIMGRVQKEWDARCREFSGEDAEEQMNAYLQYLLSITVKVLCDEFGWTGGKPGKYDRRLKLTRLSDCIVDELMRISNDEMLDIRSYSEAVYQKYGIKFYIG